MNGPVRVGSDSDFNIGVVVVLGAILCGFGLLDLAQAPSWDRGWALAGVVFVSWTSVSELRRVRRLERGPQFERSPQSEDLREALSVARRCALGMMIFFVVAIMLFRA